MGNKPKSRRGFFQALLEKNNDVITSEQITDGDDPLFEKYSTKTSGRRYSTAVVPYYSSEQATPAAAQRPPNVTSNLDPFTGVPTKDQILHLLRRTNFGWKKAYVDALTGLTASQAVDAVLAVDLTPPAPPVNWYQNIYADECVANPTTPQIAYGQDWTAGFFPTTAQGQTTNHYRMDSVRRWLFGLALNSSHSIREKMVWFWYHFIPIDFESIYQSSNANISQNCARLFYAYFKLLRTNCIGNFKELIFAISKEPAMVYYLNTQANSKTAPDENFARELMELFTLGKDPASQYTQADVVAAAKVLTGWRVEKINTASYQVNFKNSLHTTTAKQFSSFFNNAVINYVAPSPVSSDPELARLQYNAAGDAELRSLINMIFSKSDVVSKYICRRLYRYFVYYDIDANIEANIITPLAQTFVNSNWDILPVLKQLFKSQHFFDVANRGVYIKTPFDLVAGSLKLWKVDTAAADAESQYRIWSRFNDSYSLSMEQQMGSIPNVSGWNAFYQAPAYHQYWINSNAVQKRFIYIRDQYNGFTITGVAGRTFKVDVLGFVQEYFDDNTIKDPDLLVTACVQLLLPLEIGDAAKGSIKTSALLTGQSTNNYWTTAWTNYTGMPTNTGFKNIVESRLRTLLSGLCQLAEYQLM